ncbi:MULTISPECIES: helix-turn-helix domain-containing protein [Streptomyces]|uniref:helix-turn-helix domain-containing protein n=1 Tax=Streptomyces TaxID=1883 RepID=UPI00190753AC|nr:MULTISPECIES: helix-turn-helix transcriptional regulator [unclassified Streptomyces]MCU4745746.1 helix-turn-helix domain-containing protein [Streptomyces sp. G-5]QQN79288.1 helix-turn-helix domain-containing protein [Streptomyces sp. XC 2026]
MGQPVTTVRRMRLGMELRRLREQAGKSQLEAADVVDASDAKISRVESGKTGMSRLELVALLDLYEVKDETLREALVDLNRNSRKRGWWQQRKDVLSPKLMELIELESTASQIFQFESGLIPGLFQTEAYARAVISASPEPHGPSVDQGVQIRLERQKILEGSQSPRIICVLDEAAIRRQVGGPSVMAEQLRKLVCIANPPHLSIQVIPYSAGAHASMEGPFLRFVYPAPAHMDIVFLEQKASRLFIEEAAGLEPYRITEEHLRTQALSSAESMKLISAIAAELDHA